MAFKFYFHDIVILVSGNDLQMNSIGNTKIRDITDIGNPRVVGPSGPL